MDLATLLKGVADGELSIKGRSSGLLGQNWSGTWFFFVHLSVREPKPSHISELGAWKRLPKSYITTALLDIIDRVHRKSTASVWGRCRNFNIFCQSIRLIQGVVPVFFQGT